MKNAINNQFKMNPGSKEVDTHGAFKNDPAVLNMGTPSNYGTPNSAPLNSNHDDPDKKELKGKKKLPTDGMTVEQKLKYYKKQKENTNPQSSSVTMGLGSNRSSGSNILK